MPSSLISPSSSSSPTLLRVSSIPPDTPDPPPVPRPFFSCHSYRFKVALILCFALYTIVSMRSNLSMAIVCMVNASSSLSDSSPILSPPQSPPSDGECVKTGDNLQSHGYKGTLTWSQTQQNQLLSAVYYGNLMSILIAGPMADRFGPKLLISTLTLVYIAITVVSPLLALNTYAGFFAARIVLGFADGFLHPSLSSLAVKWSAPNERSSVAAIYTSGNQVANSLPHIIAPFCCASDTFGWQSIFYIGGASGVVLFVVWQIFITNFPEENRFVGNVEKGFLADHAASLRSERISTPWKAMLSSRPVHANLVCQFAFSFTMALFMAFLPQYFRDVLMLPLSLNGLFTSIPFVAQLISKNILAVVADRLKTKGIMSHTSCAKMFQAICCVGDAVALLGLAMGGSCEKRGVAALFLSLYGVFFSAGICGFFTSNLSIAPRYAGTISSLTNLVGTVANLAGAQFYGIAQYLSPDNTWTICFSVGAVSNIIAGIVFQLFGSAEPQPWSVRKVKKQSEDSTREDSVDGSTTGSK